MSTELQELARNSKAWPFQEAVALLDKRLKGKLPEKGYVLFQTGYGPSGLPHIGTFAEVVRTTMVRNAFKILAPDMPTKLFCFSDDMDGLRKVPTNIPNQDKVAEHLDKPLTQIPDPFGTHESFGHHNNARLQAFLDDFGFEYDFKSSTEYYTTGMFDEAILNVLRNYDKIMGIMLPSLREERQKTYSPFLPVCQKTGKVLQVKVLETNVEAGTIVYEDVDGSHVETPVTGGHCKLQWKCDWGMRWHALDVDYEMSGKDLTDSVRLSGKIARVLGSHSPQNLTYELFLDENGEKISKSKGNGLAVEEWLKYAPQDSLSLYMYNKPKTAKRLYFDIIPRTADDYLAHLSGFEKQDEKAKLSNPLWHIHNGQPPKPEAGLTFSILLNLVSVCHSDDSEVIWHYISRYAPDATPKSCPILNNLVGYAITYYNDFVLPNKQYRKATDGEVEALKTLKNAIEGLGENATAEEIQTEVYAIGKDSETFENLKDWFKALYQILLGQDTGPRMGSFFALFGVKESLELLEKAINNEDF
ncbi:MAG: lysine--tRNA ligase [Alphaproteobacteria bacterium]|nr:lysine--tRNA ligase [Alphaproteobacteria bacterium]